MFNWKKKIDNQEENEKRDREGRETEQKARQLAEQKAKEESERDSNLMKFARFRCHICGKPSTKPTWEKDYSYPGENSHTGSYNYSLPADLWQCKKCNKWTCKDHIHKGICQTCAEKM